MKGVVSMRDEQTRLCTFWGRASGRSGAELLGSLLLALIFLTWALPAHPSDSSVGGNFELIDHHGQTFALEDARGRVVVLTFGYTFCPDVCPMTLTTVAAALDKIGSPADEILVLFITLDPDRDTPDHLRSYVRFFHPQILGLTGTEEALRGVADQYRVRYSFFGKGERTHYSLDHTAAVYIVDPNGTLARMIPHGLPPEIMIRTLREMLDQVFLPPATG